MQRKKTAPKYKKMPTPWDASKMSPEQRARYLAFADPTDPRVRGMLSAIIMKDRKGVDEQEKEREQKRLTGILKAAEARNRLRNMRLQYQNLRVSHFRARPNRVRDTRGDVIRPPP